MRQLYQRAKSGKVKFINLWTDGPFLHTEWGTTDSDKCQKSSKECEPKNTGKANATTAEEQAILEMNAKVEKKLDAGYVVDLDAINDTAVVEISLDNLPKEFCPCKPTNKAPKGVLNSPDTYGQHKRNGHCIILVKTETGVGRVYSRGMEDITDFIGSIPTVVDAMERVPRGSMILTEFVFVKDYIDRPREIAKIVRKKDAVEALARWSEAITYGTFEVAPFDIMYHQGEFCGDTQYRQRHALLESIGYTNVPGIIENWQAMVEPARALNWEGFILRNDKDSQIRYSLNGKADRAGSWKYVFVKEDDFIVTHAEKGKAGKQTGMYAQFFISQYLQDGTLLDSGKCGPGKLDHGRLAELTKEIDSGELTFPFTIEVEFRGRQPDSGKLEFPQFVEVRYDKKPEECITDFELEI